MLITWMFELRFKVIIKLIIDNRYKFCMPDGLLYRAYTSDTGIKKK